MGKRGRAPRIPLEHRPEWARRLVAARDARGLSQSALSDATGIPQTTLGGYETGESQPDFAQLARIASVLGTRPEAIAFGSAIEPGDNDSLLGPLVERRKNDEGFVTTFLRTAAMLDQEGFNADLSFVFRLSERLYREAVGGSDHQTLRERIDSVIAGERMKLRTELEQVRKSRLQP